MKDKAQNSNAADNATDVLEMSLATSNIHIQNANESPTSIHVTSIYMAMVSWWQGASVTRVSTRPIGVDYNNAVHCW